VPDRSALAPGDVVSITIDGIGTLRNPVKRLARGG
jgi:2-keto-4-pentenoate hydratase/2-oxohepta-3-ene-1,7-dioic acid hydratase in catechol pathway